jgi:hypothetical protein
MLLLETESELSTVSKSLSEPTKENVGGTSKRTYSRERVEAKVLLLEQSLHLHHAQVFIEQVGV